MHSIVTVLLLALALTGDEKGVRQENPHVRIEIRLAPTTLVRGAAGDIIVYLTPNEGIHINTDPAMEFEFEKLSSVQLTGITSMSKDAKTGYLNTERPVRYSFTIDKNIAKGQHRMKGAIRYFYCSDTEGWCNRFVQPFDLRFTVAR